MEEWLSEAEALRPAGGEVSGAEAVERARRTMTPRSSMAVVVVDASAAEEAGDRAVVLVADLGA